MKATGIVRRIDYLGRIVIPKKLMSVMDIKVRDPIAFFTEGDSIIIQKYEPGCLFCGNAKDIVEFKGRIVCRICQTELNKTKPNSTNDEIYSQCQKN